MASITQPQPDVAPIPAPAQIAFALVVLKSKPPDVSVEEYVTQLRDHIVEGRNRPQRQISQHLDSARYWKESYENSEREKAALLNKVYELEKQQADATLLSSPVLRTPPRKDGKRRREDTSTAKANSRSKRRADLSKTPQSPARDRFSAQRDEALLSSELFGTTTLLQAFFALRMQLRGQSPALPILLTSARRLCQTISTVLNGVRSTKKPNNSGNDEYAGVWSAIRRIYHTFLEVLELLQGHSQGHSGVEALISDLSKMLAELLTCLQHIVTLDQPRKTPRTRSHSYGRADQISGLIILIACMMTDINLAKESHRGLFDALLCTFLERLGSDLFTAVFSDPLTEGLPQPPGLSQAQGGHNDQTQVELAATLRIAPHLINILRNVKPHMNQRGDIGRNGSAGVVLDKMQNTLLRGLFGDAKTAFCNSLKRPAEVESVDYTEDTVADDEEDVTSEWFVGEVWKNVGWDVLTKHIN